MKQRNTIKALVISCLLFFIAAPMVSAQAQGPAVEGWRSLLPYHQITDIAADNEVFYCATTSGMFTYNRVDGDMSAYSKATGMHDVGITAIAYDPQSKYVLMAYDNSNMDLFKDGLFYNLPDLKLAQVNGDKAVHHIVASNGMAYVSSGVGLLVVNLGKREVKETVNFFEGNASAAVFDCLIRNNRIYVATGVGLFTTTLDNPNFQNYASWEKLDAQAMQYLAMVGDRIYGAQSDTIFVWQDNEVTFFRKTDYPVTRLDGSTSGLWVSAAVSSPLAKGYGIHLNAVGATTDSFACEAPTKILQLDNGDIWFGQNSHYLSTSQHGLRKRISATETQAYYPSGPITPSAFDISAYNGELWVAHGGRNLANNPTNNRAMFSHYKDGVWKNFPWVSDNDNVQDFLRILKDRNTGKVYAASYAGGLLIMQPDGSWEVFNDGYLPEYFGNPGLYMLSGLALDDQGNLWMSNFGSSNELTVMTPGGDWYQGRSITENGGNPAHSAADVLVDDYGQKWFIAPSGGGVIVYDDNGTLEVNNDDRYRILRKGESSGNLPDNFALSMAKDKDGAIWIGTSNGIGIVYCPAEVIDRKCDASLKVVQEDQFAGHLFFEQSVYAIAVDGANRKWVGTANGVWLLSEDAGETIYRFTEENSPLPSNRILRINIDPVTGDVYFSTDKGIAVFRSTATEGSSTTEDPLLVYPNPVPPGYEGMIAVRGVAEGSDVRFTDISGQLVYRTTAFGGQAVWNGRDYTGRKVQSGVYLVFAVNKDGTEKATTKLIVHE